MYIYAYLNSEDICIAVYDLPAPVHDPQYIQIPFADQSLVGQYFDRSLFEFKVVYYYAELDEKMIVTRTLFYLSPAPTSEFFRSITFNQYLTVKGLYWDGTDYVTPPIHIQAVCSTDQVNYKNDDVWLTTVLEDMQAATGNNTVAIERNNVQIQLAKDRMDGISSVVAGEQEKIRDLVAATQNLVTATSQNAVDIQNLQATETQQNAEIARVDQNVEAVIHTANDHESAINNLGEQIEGVKADTEASFVAVDDEINDLNSRATGLESDVIACNRSIDSLTARQNETAADIANIEGEISDLEEEVAGAIAKGNTNASSIASLGTRVTNVENRATAVERRATTLESDVATNKSNITAVTNKANTNATNINNLTTKVNTNTSSISALRTDLNKYLPLAGGTLNGDLNVKGVLRMEGSQAFYYNVDAQTMNIGTNNAKVVNFGGVHSGGVSYFNSATLRPYSVVPRNSDSLLGNSTYRWKGIYSQSSVNVSSDERLKSDIKPLDKESLAAFIQALEVVKFKYIGCDEKRIGLVAQKVIAADPKLAKFFVNQSSDGYYNLKPADFVFPLIAAVQELKREIEELKK